MVFRMLWNSPPSSGRRCPAPRPPPRAPRRRARAGHCTVCIRQGRVAYCTRARTKMQHYGRGRLCSRKSGALALNIKLTHSRSTLGVLLRLSGALMILTADNLRLSAAARSARTVSAYATACAAQRAVVRNGLSYGTGAPAKPPRRTPARLSDLSHRARQGSTAGASSLRHELRLGPRARRRGHRREGRRRGAARRRRRVFVAGGSSACRGRSPP